MTVYVLATAFTYVFGCQPSVAAKANAWIANLPNAKIMKVFAFEARSRATSERTSGEVGS